MGFETPDDLPVLGPTLAGSLRVLLIPRRNSQGHLYDQRVGNKVSPESLNFQLRKVTRNRLTFVNDDAIYKIMYLAIRNASQKWTMPIRNWGMNGFRSDVSRQLHKISDKPL
jgi:hypothetical protein